MNAINLNKNLAAMNNTNVSISLCTVPSPEALLSFLRLANQPPDQTGHEKKYEIEFVCSYHLKWQYAALLNTSIH